MTIRNTETLRIPNMLVGAVIGLLITLGSVSIAMQVSSASVKKQVEINTERLWKEIPQVLDKKADKTEIEAIKGQLNRIEGTQVRIENKLDKHIDR